jgi:hypothetical protein
MASRKTSVVGVRRNEFRSQDARVAWAMTRELARTSAASPKEREAAGALVRFALKVLDGSAGPEILERLSAARLALAGCREGDVFAIRNVARLLRRLEKAWRGCLPITPIALRQSQALLGVIDVRLARVDAKMLGSMLDRLRNENLAISGAVAELMIATRAFGTAPEADRREVLGRVSRALRARAAP